MKILKKIGILTFHHVVNEGAFLQTYAVTKALQKRFGKENVEVIDLRMRNTEMRDIRNGFLSSKRPTNISSNVRRYMNFRRHYQSALPLGRKKCVTNSYEKSIRHLNGKYEAVVVGSDEIWKIEDAKLARPFPNIYWLGRDVKAKKISFAASANKLKYKKLSDKQKRWIKETLSDFDLISVRDEHTHEMLGYIDPNIANGAMIVPDPTFSLEEEFCTNKDTLSKLGVDFKKKLFGITFYDKSIPQSFYEELKRNGYQILGITARNPFVDVNLSHRLNPVEWAGVFPHLDFCLSNLFHGTIFSLKNKVPFLSVDYYSTSDYSTKMGSLLKSFKCQNSYLKPDDISNANNLLSKMNLVISTFNKKLVEEQLLANKRCVQRYLDSVESLFS